MNEKIKINPLNTKGKYYVDQENCMNHECCVVLAPHCFKLDEKIWSAYVYKQPETLEEETECRRAMENCPERAIHESGEL
jgi:ferredoxin